MFHRAVDYLAAQQESDGHWSAKKGGASEEFSGINGDITVTALCVSTMLDTNQGRNQNREGVQRAKHGLDWLSAHVDQDGKICDETAPGDPTMAQIFASFTFIEALDLSNKPALREICEKMCRYMIQKMGAKAGGYGDTKDSPNARADITAMATILFNRARLTWIGFADPQTNDESKNHAAALEFEKKFKAGIAALRSQPKGTFALSSAELKPDWNATIAGALNEKAFGMEMPEYAAGLEYLLGVKYDEFRLTKSETFPGIEKNLSWGESGEGYQALSLMQGSMLFVNEFGPERLEWAEWSKRILKLSTDHQNKDGSWNAAGSDGPRGKYWRTALQARVINVIAPQQLPPPPPQAPPPDEEKDNKQ
jgi:hypothetical protein